MLPLRSGSLLVARNTRRVSPNLPAAFLAVQRPDGALTTGNALSIGAFYGPQDVTHQASAPASDNWTAGVQIAVGVTLVVPTDYLLRLQVISGDTTATSSILVYWTAL